VVRATQTSRTPCTSSVRCNFPHTPPVHPPSSPAFSHDDRRNGRTLLRAGHRIPLLECILRTRVRPISSHHQKATGRVILLRMGRRCIGRGRLDGHSDRACDDDACESHSRSSCPASAGRRTRTHVTLRGRPLPSSRQVARQDGHRHREDRFLVEAVQFSYFHLSWSDERI